MDELKDRLLLINEGCEDLDYALPRAGPFQERVDNALKGLSVPTAELLAILRPL